MSEPTPCQKLTDLFFSTDTRERRLAAGLCHGCEARKQCARHTLEIIDREGWSGLGSGVWAGISVKPNDAYRLRQRKMEFLKEAISFRHTQDVPARTWTVIHRLPFQPNVTVVNAMRTVIYAEVEFITEDTIRVYFSEPMAGEVYLS